MKKNIGISIIIAVIFLIIGILIGKDIKIEDKNISADTYIQENTHLCEYTGNVITLQDYYKKLKNKEIEKMTLSWI